MSILRRVTPRHGVPQRRRKLVIAADSVAASRRSDSEVLSGWGQHLDGLIEDGVDVVNTASDSCTTHWYFRNRLPTVLESLAPGDLFLIGFGVCEQAVARPDLHRTPYEFEAYLNLYVDTLHERCITPVLVTQTSRHLFDSGGIPKPPVGSYSECTRRVAAEREVALLDLERLTAGLLAGWGPDRARGFFRWFDAGQHYDVPDGIIDTLHLNRQGAQAVAQLVADELHALELVAPATRQASPSLPPPIPVYPYAASDASPGWQSFPISQEPPVVLDPRKGLPAHPTLRFTGTASPGTTHVLLCVNDTVVGAAGVGLSGTWQWRRTVVWPDGEHELEVVAVSDAGRSAPAKVCFRVEGHVPTPKVVVPAAGSLNGPSPVFKGTVAPGVRAVNVSCQGRWLGQADLTDTQWRYRLPHDWWPGSHTISFTAVGNSGVSPETVLAFDVLAVPPGNWLQGQGSWQACVVGRACDHIKRCKPAEASNLLE